MADHRARLVRFYEKWAPDKVVSVDEALKAYAGKEEAMFKALVKKYGPEPPEHSGGGRHASKTDGASGGGADSHASKTDGDSGGGGRDKKNDHRARLVRFYEKWAPDKVASVDEALKAYAGKEEAMFKALVKKYGPEPPEHSGGGRHASKTDGASGGGADSHASKTDGDSGGGGRDKKNDHRARLVRFYEKWAPDKVASVDEALKAYAGKEEAMFKALVKKYGPEPPEHSGGGRHASKTDGASGGGADSHASKTDGDSGDGGRDGKSDHRARLVRFYEKWAPDKVASVDAALKAYAGKEEPMFKALVKKYGPEPDTAGSDGGSDYRSRLVRFYEKWAPDKMSSVDVALKSYAGKEESMFTALVKKYGPEPEIKADAAGAEGGSDEDPSSYSARLKRLLQRYSPSHIPQIPKLLEKHKGKEEELIEQFVKKYGSEPSGPEESSDPRTFSQQLEAFFNMYEPNNVAMIPTLLAKYAGKEQELKDKLIKKYGPMPPPSTVEVAPEPAAAGEAAAPPPTDQTPNTLTPTTASAVVYQSREAIPKPQGDTPTAVLASIIGCRGLTSWYKMNNVLNNLQPVEGEELSPEAMTVEKLDQQRENLNRLALVLETIPFQYLDVELPPPLMENDSVQAAAIAPLLPGNMSDERVEKEVLQSYPMQPPTPVDISAFRIGYQLFTLMAQYKAFVERDLFGKERNEAIMLEQMRIADLVRIKQLDQDRLMRLRQVWTHAMRLLPTVESEHRDRIAHQQDVCRHGIIKWHNDKMAMLLVNSTPTAVQKLEQRFHNWKDLVSGKGLYTGMSPKEAARASEHRKFFTDVGSPGGVQTWATPDRNSNAMNYWLNPRASASVNNLYPYASPSHKLNASGSCATTNIASTNSPISVRSFMNSPGPTSSVRFYNMSSEHEQMARVRNKFEKEVMKEAQRAAVAPAKKVTLYSLNRPYPEDI